MYFYDNARWKKKAEYPLSALMLLKDEATVVDLGRHQIYNVKQHIFILKPQAVTINSKGESNLKHRDRLPKQ